MEPADRSRHRRLYRRQPVGPIARLFHLAVVEKMIPPVEFDHLRKDNNGNHQAVCHSALLCYHAPRYLIPARPINDDAWNDG